MSKSILLITHELSYTGAPRCLYNLAKCLLEEGYSVSVWSLETGEFFHEFVSLGLEITYIKSEEFKSAAVRRALNCPPPEAISPYFTHAG